MAAETDDKGGSKGGSFEVGDVVMLEKVLSYINVNLPKKTCPMSSN